MGVYLSAALKISSKRAVGDAFRKKTHEPRKPHEQKAAFSNQN
jgi:hypothetical protein